MKPERNITFYYLSVLPAPSEFCGVDEADSMYFHPGAISEALRHKALRDRVTVFVRIPADIVPLVTFSWAEEVLDEEELNSLDILKGAFRRFIKAGAQPHYYPLADVSLPGQPAFTDALLRTLSADKDY
jgi:hypothetical protein